MYTCMYMYVFAGSKFGTTTNSKGYKLLPPYLRVIQVYLIYIHTCTLYMHVHVRVRTCVHVHVQYTSKKSCQYRLPFHRFQFRFPRRSVLPFYRSVHRFTVHRLPFRSPFYRSVLPFYRFTVPSIDYRESGR